MTGIDLLSIERGAIIAPAGCGKTWEIVEAIRRHEGPRPLLVLTHTNAGVAAIRLRLAGTAVRASQYRLATIDGWLMRLVRHFPLRSGLSGHELEARLESRDYSAIRRAAARALADGNLDDLLATTYAGVIVDEYQDCSVVQHEVTMALSRSLPTRVLGDPAQAIFGFRDDSLPVWTEVLRYFPVAAVLNTPWRWINTGADELGHWLLSARLNLQAGAGVDLRSAPSAVEWRRLDGRQDHAVRLRAAMVGLRPGESSVLVMSDGRRVERQQTIAGQTAGALAVEGVDLPDLMSFARAFNPEDRGSLSVLLDFAGSVMVKADIPALRGRLKSLSGGRARLPATPLESACLAYETDPSYAGASLILDMVARRPGVRVHRRTTFYCALRALSACEPHLGDLYQAAVRERERYRLTGRPLAARSVGSTLLMKGLEADVAVVLDADGMDSRNLYVAMSRGSRRLLVCATNPVLGVTHGASTTRRRSQ